ncbi:MAG: hypothetical protein K0S66_276 [Sphingomonas sp.]|nr:hypothetical protein [Sphingomonas sp.]
MLDVIVSNMALTWLITAVALGIAELLIPGVFLIFVAIAAAVLAAVTFAFPDLPLAVQLAVFGAWSVMTVMIGQSWYRDYPVHTSDPMLNDRAARLVGEQVVVTTPIVAGRGRIRIGDGEWPATGPDTPEGTTVRIVKFDGVTAVVERT